MRGPKFSIARASSSALVKPSRRPTRSSPRPPLRSQRPTCGSRWASQPKPLLPTAGCALCVPMVADICAALSGSVLSLPQVVALAKVPDGPNERELEMAKAKLREAEEQLREASIKISFVTRKVRHPTIYDQLSCEQHLGMLGMPYDATRHGSRNTQDPARPNCPFRTLCIRCHALHCELTTRVL